MKNTDLLPYWSNHTKELSKDLWIPSKNSLASIFPNKLHHHSWFNFVSFNNQNSLNKFNINLPVEQSNKPLLRAKKIRIYPNIQQKNLFRQWFGTSRKTYNDTVNHLNLPQEQREKHWMGAAKLILNSLPDWAKSIPYQVKKIAVEDAYKAFSNGCKKAKKKGNLFNLNIEPGKTLDNPVLFHHQH